MTLKKVADNSDPEAFSEIEKENLQKLIKEGFCIVRDDDSVIVNAIVFRDHMKTQLHEYVDTLPEYICLKRICAILSML